MDFDFLYPMMGVYGVIAILMVNERMDALHNFSPRSGTI